MGGLFLFVLLLIACVRSDDTGICFKASNCVDGVGCGFSLGKDTANGECVDSNFTIILANGKTMGFPSMTIERATPTAYQAVFWLHPGCAGTGFPNSPRCSAQQCCPFDVSVAIGSHAFGWFYVGGNGTDTSGDKTQMILGLSLGLGLPLLVGAIVVLTCIFGRRKKRAQYKVLDWWVHGMVLMCLHSTLNWQSFSFRSISDWTRHDEKARLVLLNPSQQRVARFDGLALGCERPKGRKELESLTGPNKHRLVVCAVHVYIHRDLGKMSTKCCHLNCCLPPTDELADAQTDTDERDGAVLILCCTEE